MKAGVGLLLALWCGITAAADWKKGMVTIDNGQELYVEYRPAAEGKHTLFMLNGLTWSTRDWSSFVQAMDEIDPGIGFVLYDMRGMGRTLLEYAPIRENIAFDQQVDDLKGLRKALDVQGRTALVGLSYGGALALLIQQNIPAISIFLWPLLLLLSDSPTKI